MENKKLFATTALSVALVATAAFATDTKDFVAKASVSSLYEIESSKIAVERSQDAEVKAFAQQMITDHTKASEDLKAALKDGKPEFAPATALDDAHQKKIDKLKEAEVKDFDKLYVNQQEDAHDDAVALFKDYADDGDNTALKAFAAKTLPVLEQHDKHVEKLEDKKD